MVLAKSCDLVCTIFAMGEKIQETGLLVSLTGWL